MDFEYTNSSTLSSLSGEFASTESPNSDILNDTLKKIKEVINDKDMVRKEEP
jgi:hypothetical protein